MKVSYEQRILKESIDQYQLARLGDEKKAAKSFDT